MFHIYVQRFHTNLDDYIDTRKVVAGSNPTYDCFLFLKFYLSRRSIDQI